MAQGKGGKAPAGGDAAHRGGDGHNKGGGKAEASIASQVWNHLPKAITKHFESTPKHADKASAPAHKPSALEKGVTRFLHDPVKEGKRLYNQYVVHKPAEKQKGGDGQKNAHPEKLSQAERAKQGIREGDVNGHKQHYDKQGRIEKVEGKKDTTINVHYDKGNKPISAEVMKDGQVIKAFKQNENVSLRIDASGDLIASQKVLYKPDDSTTPKAAYQEERVTADGAGSVIRRNEKGERLDKSVYGPDQKTANYTRYQYNRGGKGKGGDSSVVATVYAGDGRTLRSEFIYEKPEAVEKNDASVRIDFNKKEETRGRVVETTATYNLHQDRENPVARSAKVSDYNKGEREITQQAFHGKELLSERKITTDEMGKTTGIHIDVPADKIHVDVKCNKNGKPESVKGEKGSVDDASLLRSAEMILIQTGKIEPLAHEQLLAHRGPTAPREGEKPSGTLVFREWNEYTSIRAVRGEIKEGNKVIGHVKDNGDVEINGKTFNIITDKDKSAAFMGMGTDGRHLDLTQGQNKTTPKEGFSGFITNGAENKLVLGGHIFSSTDKSLFGHVDESGKMEFAKNLDQKEKQATDISAVMKGGYVFSGNENGKAREFNLDRTSKGTATLNIEGKQENVEIRLGMILDTKTGEQLGKYTPPRMSDGGKFDEGHLLYKGKEISLSSLEQSSFNITVDGQDKPMRGYVLSKQIVQADGTLKPGASGCVDVDAFLKTEEQKREAIAKEFTDRQEELALYKRTAAKDPHVSQLASTGIESDLQKKIDEKQKELAAFDTQLEKEKKAADTLGKGGNFDQETIKRMQDFSKYDPLVNLGALSNDPKARLIKLQEAADNRKHLLENFHEKSKVSGDFIAPDPNDPSNANKKIAVEVKDNIITRPGSKDIIGSLDPQTGKITMFDDRGNKLTTELGHPAMKGTVYHLTGTNSDGKPQTVDWINDGTGRLQSADELRRFVAYEKGLAVLKAGSSDDSQIKSQLTRTTELERRYVTMLDESIKNRHVSLDTVNGVSALDMVRGGPSQFVRAEHYREGHTFTGGTISVPALQKPEDCKDVSGDMRVGNKHYYVKDGLIYKMSLQSAEYHLKFDMLGIDTKLGSGKQWTPDAKPCGVFQPGYIATIDGQTINLQNDQNFLFKMKTGKDGQEHLVMGLGETRRDAGGRLVAGGLIDARDLIRQADQAKKEVDLQTKLYKDGSGKFVGALPDNLIGGREAVLDNVQGSAAASRDALERQINESFRDGLYGHTLSTKELDQNSRSVQNIMRDLKLSATDSQEMSTQGLAYQQGTREGLAMAATAVATGGSSVLVQWGMVSARTGLVLAAATGGVGSAAIRQTRAGGWDEFGRNTLSGTAETLLMSGGNVASAFTKSLNTVSKEATLCKLASKSEYLNPLQQLARTEGGSAALLKGVTELSTISKESQITSKTLQELAKNPVAMEMADLLAKGKKDAVEAFCQVLASKPASEALRVTNGNLIGLRTLTTGTDVASALTQSFVSTNAAAYRTQTYDDLTFKDILEGGGFNWLGDRASGLFSSKALGHWEYKSGKAGYFDKAITGMPDAIVTNALSSYFTANAKVKDVERQNIANQWGMRKEEIDEKLFEELKDETRMRQYIYDQTLQAAATAVFTHPITSSLTHAASRHFERQQERHIEAMKNAGLLLDGPALTAMDTIQAAPSNRAIILKDENGRAMTMLKDTEGNLLEVRTAGGPTFKKENGQWKSDHEGFDNIADVTADRTGKMVITRNDRSTLTVHPDGRAIEEGSPAPGHHVVVVNDKHGNNYGLHSENGVLRTIRSPHGEVQIAWGADGKPSGLKLSDTVTLQKDDQGWSLYDKGVRQKARAFDDVQISADGTITKMRQAQGTEPAFKTTEHIDGTFIVVKDGVITRSKNLRGETIDFAYDQNKNLVSLEMPGAVKFVKEASGWVKHTEIPGRTKGKEEFASVSVDEKGKVTAIDRNGVIIEHSLDGKTKASVTGDPREPLNLQTQKQHFEQVAKNIDDPIARMHIENGLFELEQRLKATSAKPEESMAGIMHDVNRMLSNPGKFTAQEMPRIIDEALSMATDPELISQGTNATCVITAYQQRAFAVQPELMFTMLRRIHEHGVVLGADGQAVKYDQKNKNQTPDNDALQHYAGSDPLQTRVDGKRLRASQILQQGMDDVIAGHIPTHKAGVYNILEIEPLHQFLTGKHEAIVVANPKSEEDLCAQLLDRKESGILYPLLFMDARHTGARGAGESGGHVRLVKDIRQDQNSTKDELVIDLANSWYRWQSHQSLSPRRVYEQTLAGHTPENLEALLNRQNALEAQKRENKPQDVYEKAELVAWKVGFMEAALKGRKESIRDDFAEDALLQLNHGQKYTVENLRAEIAQVRQDLSEHLGDKTRIAREKEYADILEGLASRIYRLSRTERNNPELPSPPKTKSDETGPNGKEQNLEARAAARGETGLPKDGGRPVSSLDLANRSRAKAEAYEEASLVDHVTNYKNKKGMMKFVEKAIERANATGEPLHFCYIDIRKFKNVNKVIGNAGGDDALCFLTKHIAKELGIREDELVARPGGDEIALALFRPKEEVDAMVKKIEETYLAVRAFDEPGANGKTYGMKLVSPEHVREVEQGRVKSSDLIIYPVAGVVTYQRASENQVADNPKHLVDRADAKMTVRKNIDDLIVEEKKNNNGVATTQQIAAFDETYSVKIRHSDREARKTLDFVEPPKLTSADIRTYLSLGETERAAHLANLESELKAAKILRENGDESAKSIDIAYKSRLIQDIKVYEEAKPEDRAGILEIIDSLQEIYKARKDQYQDAWLNPNTKLENREMANRELLRTVYDAQRLQKEPGFQPPTLFMVDIDNMKPVNDTQGLGHLAGDALMEHAGQYLRDKLPPGTKVFSPSGGSFIIIAKNEADQESIRNTIKQYGTDPRTQAIRATADKSSEHVPAINLTLVDNNEKLMFGLSYGEATLDMASLGNAKTHSAYRSGAENLKTTADDLLTQDKDARIAEGRLKPRKEMEEPGKAAHDETYDKWQKFLSDDSSNESADESANENWQRPGKGVSVFEDTRAILSERSTQRQRAKEEENLKKYEAGSDQDAGFTKEDDDVPDIASLLANLHATVRATEDDSKPLNIKESSLIPKDYMPGKEEVTKENKQKNGDNNNGGKEGDGKTQYPSQQFDHHVESTPEEKINQTQQRLDGQRPMPQEYHTQLEAQRLQRNADSRKLFSKEGAAEETIEEASYVYRGGLTKNHAKALDNPDSKALDNLLYRQFKIDSDPKYGDNTLKTYINAVDACIKDWTPTTDATILDSRKQALQKVFDDFYKSIGVPSPKIEVDKSMVLDAEGANASYSLGKNVITIQESMLQGYDQKLIIDTAHEGIGHAVQDQQSDRIVMYEMMKRSGIEKTSALFEEDGKTLNSLGEGFLSGVAAQEKPIKGDVDRALLLDNLQLSKEWLDTRVGDAKFDPRQDADYMRGLRVVRSLLDENGVETDRQGKPSMVSQDRLKRLVNLMTGKDINDSVLTGPNETYASLSLDVNNQLKRERGVDTIADPQKVFEQLLKQENEDRQERFNRHGRKDEPAAYTVDQKFEQMLASPKFFENNKEFLSKYVEMKQTNDPVRLVELRKEWQEVFKSENPGSPAPSTHLVTSRLDRVAYLFMENHFQNKDAADLGSMTREKFMEVRGNLAREVLRDALEAQNVRDYNRYRASYYEFDAHFIHQRVERMLKTNDRTLKLDGELNAPRTERQLALARNFEPVKAKTNEIKRLQPAWQDASPLPTKFAKAKEEEAPPVKPRGAISLFSKALADQYKKIDPMADRTKPEEQKYNDLKEQLEIDVRSKLQDLISYMVPEKQGEQLSGYELPAKLRSASGAEGDAQQEAFFKRLTKAINDGSLMDLKNAGHPEVVVHNDALVKTIEQEFPTELSFEKNRGLRLGLTAAEANQRALVKVITDLGNGKLVNEVAEDALIEAQDRATERASHWIGLPVPSGSLLDQIGCDYLLVNKHTGEYYPLDVTIKGQDRTDRLVECQAQNTNLHWQPASAVGEKQGKMVPAERTPWVMSVVDDLTWGNLLFRAQQKSQGKIADIKADLERQTVDSTAVAVMSMLQTPSGLNLYDHPLPSLKTDLVSKQKQHELDLYVPILKTAGKHAWAKDIDTRVRTYIKNNP